MAYGAGRVKDIDGTLEADEAICRAGRGERRLRTLHSVSSNFATLILRTEVMQRKASARVNYIPIVAMYYCIAYHGINITRRGLACVAYPCEGAMRRPELRDEREVRISHAFFVSIFQ